MFATSPPSSVVGSVVDPPGVLRSAAWVAPAPELAAPGLTITAKISWILTAMLDDPKTGARQKWSASGVQVKRRLDDAGFKIHSSDFYTNSAPRVSIQ